LCLRSRYDVQNIIIHYVMLFGVMLISVIPCLFVLLRVDEQAIEDPGVQEVQTAEKELIEGKLFP
jgi:hypothetical protein